MLFKEPVLLRPGPTTSILIRARSVVQVHPGPPFKSPVDTRLFSLFGVQRIFLQKPICQPFVNFPNSRIPEPPVLQQPFLGLGALRCRACRWTSRGGGYSSGLLSPSAHRIAGRPHFLPFRHVLHFVLGRREVACGSEDPSEVLGILKS